MKLRAFFALALAAFLVGCGDNGGGNDNPDAGNGDDAGCRIPAPEGAPQFDSVAEVPRFVVTGTNFESSFYGWLNAEGDAIDGDWINSGTTRPGLVATLSGDTTFATKLAGDGSFYVIDRYGTDVVTRVSIPEGVVIGQVRTHGDACDSAFSSNPGDIVPVSATQAFVTRYSYDATGSAAPDCRGSDLLEIDPSTMTRTGNTVDLTSFAVANVSYRPLPANEGDEPPALVMTTVQPRPSRAFLLGNGLIVVGLERLSGNYRAAAPGVLAVVSPASRTVVGSEVLDGLENCGGIMPIPGSPNRVAVVCTGRDRNDYTDENEADERGSSGIVVLEVAADGQITEIAAWRALEHEADPALAGGAVFFDSTHAAVIRRGTWGSSEDPDDVYLLDLTTGAHTLLFTAATGYDIYGSMSFDPTTRLLIVADRTAGLRRFTVDAALTSATTLTTVTNLGPGGIPAVSTGLVDIGAHTCD